MPATMTDRGARPTRARAARPKPAGRWSRGRHDWTALEAAYLATTHGDLARFAKEAGVRVDVIRRKAAAGGWRGRWAEVQAQALEQAQAATVTNRAEQIATTNEAHFAAAEIVLRGIRAYTDELRNGNGGRLMLRPEEALRMANALGRIQTVQRIALGVPTEKQAREVSGPDGGPIPVQMSTLTIHVVQARESPEPPEPVDGED